MVTFSKEIVDAVVAHMGEDHAADNLVIARAFGAPEASAAVFVGLDADASYWRVTEPAGERDLKIEWINGPISERPEIRREVVVLHTKAQEALGLKEPVAESDAKPFSQELREGSWNDHDDSEGADFMASIMRGVASLDDYVQLVVQHYFMYEALEAIAAEHRDNPDFAPFYETDLLRMQALAADLEQLVGPDWQNQISALPATKAYADRMREVGASGWIPGLIAHHYTRYLGDLSGGQMIARRVANQHGFDGQKGIEFYNFATLGSIDEFKTRYRAALDNLGAALSADDKEQMLQEVRTAYRFNTEVFIDLAKAKLAAQSA